jgi:hypothetical protein
MIQILIFPIGVAATSGAIDAWRIGKNKRVRHGLKYVSLSVLFCLHSIFTYGHFDLQCVSLYTIFQLVVYSIVFDHWLNILRGKSIFYLSDSSRPEKYFAGAGIFGYIFYNFFKLFLIAELFIQFHLYGLCY